MQHFSETQEESTTFRGITNISNISYREFPFYVTFLTKFLEFKHFSWMVGLFEMQQFPVFQETFWKNFPSIFLRY